MLQKVMRSGVENFSKRGFEGIPISFFHKNEITPLLSGLIVPPGALNLKGIEELYINILFAA